VAANPDRLIKGLPATEYFARYREEHREEIRAKGRERQLKKNRQAGMFESGSPEHRERMRQCRKAKGEEHGNWKGDDVGYDALHDWVKRNKPRTGICEACGKKPRTWTHLANVSGEYRRDVADFIELCASCHKKRDLAETRGARERFERRVATTPV
jgi:hypothetical protein